MRLAFLFLFFTGNFVFAQELTFRQALERMLQENPSFSQKKINSQISQNYVQQVKSAYYPQLDFVQSWSSSNNPIYVFGGLLNQQRFGAANFAIDSLNHPDALTDVSSRFQAGWLIYDFGRREDNIRNAKTNAQIASLELNSVQLSLLMELVKRYYAVSLIRERISVAANAVVSSESRLQQARDRVEQGLVVESDQLAAEVFHTRRLQEKIDAENQFKLANASLLELFGDQSEIEVKTSQLTEKKFPDYPLERWLEKMKNQRPELKIRAAATELAQTQVGMERSNFFPSLHAWSNYEWHGDSLDYTGDSWGAGVELRWNLFRGFSDQSRLQAARLELKNALEKRRETENALSLQLKDYFYRFQSAKEKLSTAAVSLRQAEESKRIYGDRYLNGLVTIQDSLQAETAYNETRLIYSQNIYDLYVAYAGLLAASGDVAALQEDVHR